MRVLKAIDWDSIEKFVADLVRQEMLLMMAVEDGRGQDVTPHDEIIQQHLESQEP